MWEGIGRRFGSASAYVAKTALDLTDSVNAALDVGAEDEEIAIYKKMLADFQFEQINLSREYQKIVAEKEMDCNEMRIKLEAATSPDSSDRHDASSLPSPSAHNDYSHDPDQMMEVERLKVQNEILDDTVKAWEKKLRDLLLEKTEFAATIRRQQGVISTFENVKPPPVPPSGSNGFGFSPTSRSAKVGSPTSSSNSNPNSNPKTPLSPTPASNSRDQQTIDDLVTEYSKLSGENENKREENMELKKRCEEYATKLIAHEKNIMMLTAANHNGVDSNDDKNSNSNSNTNANMKLENTIATLKNALKSSEEMLKTQSEELAELSAMAVSQKSSFAADVQRVKAKSADDLVAAKEALEQEIEALNTSKGDSFVEMKVNLEANVSELEKENAKLQASLKANDESHEESQSDLKKSLALREESVSQLKRSVKQKDENLISTMKEKDGVLKASMKEKDEHWEEIVAKREEKLVNLQAQIVRERENTEGQAKMNELLAEKDKEFSLLEEKLALREEDFGKLVYEKEADIKAFEEKMGEELEEKEATHSQLVSEMEATHRNLVSEKEAETKSLEEKMGAKLEEKEVANEQLVSSKEAEYRKMVTEKNAVHALLIDELNKSLQAAETEHTHKLQSFADEHAQMIISHDEQIKLLNAEHVNTVHTITVAHTTELAVLNDEHATANKNQINEHDNILTSLNDEHDSATATLTETHDNAVSTMQAEHLVQLQTLGEKLKHTMADLESVEVRWREKIASELASAAEAAEQNLAEKLEEQRQSFLDQIAAANTERDECKELYLKENGRRKLIHNKLIEIQGNIRVVARVRPAVAQELKQQDHREVIECTTNEDLTVHRDKTTRTKFEFDKVCDQGSSQVEAYEMAAALTTSVLDGYNVCIFAYGQTGSGKTFTMEGPEDNRGVNFRALKDLFEVVEERAEDMDYVCNLSILEIYNETIRDILNPQFDEYKQPKKLDIRQSADGGNVVQGLSETVITGAEEVFDLIEGSSKNRAVGSHDMNEHSSRSHLILTVRVEGVDKHNGVVTKAKLNLIDLAGSERISKTDAEGDRLKEAQNINKSLSALGDVINALGQKKAGHVPYRNSKLTFLLQESLGGNSKVMMYVNISPVSYNMNESLCSLAFAARCRTVQLGGAKKNDDTKDKEIMRLKGMLRKASLT